MRPGPSQFTQTQRSLGSRLCHSHQPATPSEETKDRTTTTSFFLQLCALQEIHVDVDLSNMSSGTEHLKRTFSVCLNQKQHFESYFMDNWQNYEHRQEVPTTKLKCGIVPCLFFRACKDPSSPSLFTCLFDSNLSARRHGSAVEKIREPRGTHIHDFVHGRIDYLMRCGR